MDFKNSAFMYLLGGLVGLFVIAQSLYFLIRAVRRSRQLGISGVTIRRTVASSAVGLHPARPHHPGQDAGAAAAVDPPERAGRRHL